MRGMLILILVLPMLASCQVYDNWRARTDFEEICEIATTFKRKQGEDPATMQVRMALSFEEVVDSRAAQMTLAAVANVQGDQRYMMMQMAAEEVGLTGFSCPPLEKLFVPPQF